MATTKYETDYEKAKQALGDRDPIADIASLNRSLHRRFEKAKALEAEVRALREALLSVSVCSGDHCLRCRGTLARALAPEPPDA